MGGNPWYRKHLFEEFGAVSRWCGVPALLVQQITDTKLVAPRQVWFSLWWWSCPNSRTSVTTPQRPSLFNLEVDLLAGHYILLRHIIIIALHCFNVLAESLAKFPVQSVSSRWEICDWVQGNPQCDLSRSSVRLYTIKKFVAEIRLSLHHCVTTLLKFCTTHQMLCGKFLLRSIRPCCCILQNMELLSRQRMRRILVGQYRSL